MLALPALPDSAGEFYLPLSEGTARRIAGNMLAGEHATEFAPKDLLLDPAIVCWALCRIRSAKKITLESLADWLNHHNWIRAFAGDVHPLDDLSDAPSKVRRCRQLTKQAYRRAFQATRGDLDSHATVVALADDAVRWFSVISQRASGQTLPRCMPALQLRRSGKSPPAGDFELARKQTKRVKRVWSRNEEWSRLVRHLAVTLSRADRLERRFEATLNQEKLKAMRELAYGASHEINNPLANISTRAQMLMRDEPEPGRKRNLAAIAHQAFRAHEMITDMMLFAKPPGISLRSTALSEVLKQCRQELQSEFQPPENVTWRIDSSCKKYEVLADPSALAIALKAIFQNSIEAIEERGTISVRAAGEKYGETVSVRISDSGPGIPDALRRRIFDPFYSGREAGRGLGFGLPKAWQIIRQHGGRLTLESNKNRTEFVARLKAAHTRD